MKDDLIVQFVCFATKLATEEFVARWEPCVAQLTKTSREIILDEAIGKNKYRYVSQHYSLLSDFRFIFTKGQRDEHFSKNDTRVIQAGGYKPVRPITRQHLGTDSIKIIAFIDHNHRFPGFDFDERHKPANIYEAYYESCTHSFILEFFLEENDTPELIQELRTKDISEIAVYKQCRSIPAVHKKTPVVL